MSEDVDWYNLIAIKRGKPADWRWCEVRVIGEWSSGDTLVIGGVPRVLKSGANKGKRTWRGVPRDELIVTRDQLRDAQTAWEIETGKCYACTGTGQTLVGCSSNGERKTRPCKRCAGTGGFKASDDVAIGAAS